MGPFLMVALAWIVFAIRYLLSKNRSLRSLMPQLLFPPAFCLLAVSHWFLHSNARFEAMELSGYPDVMQQIQNGLIVTRSGLVIAAFGGFSLVGCGLMFLLPTTEKREDVQGADGKRRSPDN